MSQIPCKSIKTLKKPFLFSMYRSVKTDQSNDRNHETQLDCVNTQGMLKHHIADFASICHSIYFISQINVQCAEGQYKGNALLQRHKSLAFDEAIHKLPYSLRLAGRVDIAIQSHCTWRRIQSLSTLLQTKLSVTQLVSHGTHSGCSHQILFIFFYRNIHTYPKLN